MITFITVRPGTRARFVSASAEKKLPGILVVHGWKSDNPFNENGTNTRIQEVLKEAGYNSLLIALRGHQPSNGSIGAVTREEHLDDLRAGLAWLSSNSEVDASNIGSVGSSYGAYLVSVLAATQSFKLVALRVPALYPDEGWNEPSAEVTISPALHAWREIVHTKDQCRALSGIACVEGPVALFTSENDEFMPPAITTSYLQAARSGEAFVLEGAKHVLNRPQTKEFLQSLKSWFQEKSSGLH